MVQTDKIQNIFYFLETIKKNNNREWFLANKEWYEMVYQSFKEIVKELILELSIYIPELSRVSVEQTLYRFYRDIRFSTDKSPYKTHFGAYINAYGKKSYHGGYYIQMMPGNSFIAGGAYEYPSHILRAIRNSIFNEIDRYLSIVESNDFSKNFPTIGFSHLKKCPKDFPKDWVYLNYITPKNFVVSTALDDKFFLNTNWMKEVIDKFILMKPLVEFINETVDDYI